MKKAIRIMAGFALAMIGVIFMEMQLYPEWHEKQEIKKVQEIAEKTVSLDTSESTAVPVDFDALRKINPDIIGWIRVEGTEISYPIMQSSEDEEEDFYLHHSFRKGYSSHGSIYMQKINSSGFSDFNTIVYGHNMRDMSMFQQLHCFREKDFFDKHDEITIYTPDNIFHYTIFAAYITENVLILDSWGSFENDELKKNYIEYLQTIGGNSRDVELDTKSRILTLSTCCGDDTKRLLVQSVLKKVNNAMN